MYQQKKIPIQFTLDGFVIFYFCCDDGVWMGELYKLGWLMGWYVGNMWADSFIFRDFGEENVLKFLYCISISWRPQDGRHDRSSLKPAQAMCNISIRALSIPSWALGNLVVMAEVYYAVKSKAVSGLWQWDHLFGSGKGSSRLWNWKTGTLACTNWQVAKWTSDFWKKKKSESSVVCMQTVVRVNEAWSLLTFSTCPHYMP